MDWKNKEGAKLKEIQTKRTIQTKEKNIHPINGIYEKAYKEMIKRNGSFREWITSYLALEEKFTNTKDKHKINIIENFKITQIFYKDEKNLSKNYIEINNKKFSFKNKLSKKTKREINIICKRLDKNKNRFSIVGLIDRYKLKLKVNPAIINSIKRYYKCCMDEYIKNYLKSNKTKALFSNDKYMQEIKIEFAKVCHNTIENYIRDLKYKTNYIHIQEKADNYRYKEGDKSFVKKVSIKNKKNSDKNGVSRKNNISSKGQIQISI